VRRFVMAARVSYSVPILRVKDVERVVRFYELLGFTQTAVLRTEDGLPYWAHLSCQRGNIAANESCTQDTSIGASEQYESPSPVARKSENESAAVMVSLGEDPHAPIDAAKQCASLYLLSKELEGLRAQLVRQGVEVTEIVTSEYMKNGEMELCDPDGWRIFVGGV
jgi:hypothetical protein